EALARQRQQMLTLDRRRLTHRLLASVDAARLVLATPGQQHGVQVLQVARRRHRDEVISAEEAGFAFDAPFSCPSPGVQKLASKFQCERNATKRAVSSRRM